MSTFPFLNEPVKVGLFCAVVRKVNRETGRALVRFWNRPDTMKQKEWVNVRDLKRIS